jgi:hypothetical protein
MTVVGVRVRDEWFDYRPQLQSAEKDYAENVGTSLGDPAWAIMPGRRLLRQGGAGGLAGSVRAGIFAGEKPS